MAAADKDSPDFRLESPEDSSSGAARLILTGSWRMDRQLPSPKQLQKALDKTPGLKSLAFDTQAVSGWDSGLVASIDALRIQCLKRGINCELDGLPKDIQALLRMASNPADKPKTAHQDIAPLGLLQQFGTDLLDLARSTGEILSFLGQVMIALQRFLRGKARYKRAELWVLIQEAGADALPIVSLVSFLVGMILAYIGDQQLKLFGAQIYVADLVGLATVIQMGALITAIVLAGRTGAAYAARIGSMQVNEEIDALRTLGISPMEFVVLPRMIALILMTPLLAIYADFIGILGGAFVGTTVGGVTLTAYLVQTQAAIGWNHIIQGLIAASVYGAIVAASGCLRGMQSGRSAASVGEATTSAVVTAIVFIVIAAAILTIIFDAIGLS